MANPWFRMYSEFATDAKVQSVSEPMQRRLLMLFCLRSCDVLVTLHDDELAFQLRITEQELAETKALFMRKGFINDAWEITNWDKRQFVSDSSSHRTAAFRERKKNVTRTSQERHSDAPDTDTDTDTDTEQMHKKIKEPPKPSASSELFDGIDSQVVADFKALRTKLKAPITKTSIDGIKREADIAGLSLEAALKMCCERGWRGFNAEWLTKPARASPGYQTPNEKAKSFADRLTGNRKNEQISFIDLN